MVGTLAACCESGATRRQRHWPVKPAGRSCRLRAFRQSLSETGFVEGRNVAIDYRWAGDELDRLPALAADLVRRQVNVISGLRTTQATRC
jgi:hypothetical protein